MSLIINGPTLLREAPIKDMAKKKLIREGMSYGLGEAGYDICIKQEIRFRIREKAEPFTVVINPSSADDRVFTEGTFCLASSVEEFEMPANLVGMVFDKSSWARRGLSLFNTIIEPGWKGFLTLELVYHGRTDLIIPAGSPIAQVVFLNTVHSSPYQGKYQNQADRPVSAIHEEPT